jgi:HPt (histidine-containing phosphotransfer) domain-containing protein
MTPEPPDSAAAQPASMSDALRAIWDRGLSLTRERVALLERAAEQLSDTRALDADLHAEALATAHKLAGLLGMFGFPKGTEHARAIEVELSKPGLPQPERLKTHVDSLVASLPLVDEAYNRSVTSSPAQRGQ